MKNFDLIIASGSTIWYNKKAMDFSAFKTGGSVDTLIVPNNVDSLKIALNETANSYVLGNTTNSLISDKGYAGQIVLTNNVVGAEVKDNYITAMCGESLTKVCNLAKANCLGGMQALCGIPGTIGGAIAMNAGAFGTFMSDIVEEVQAYIDGDVKVLTNDECGFSYRSSIFNGKDKIVLSAKLKLEFCNQYSIINQMKKYKNIRRKSQPNEISLGSVFKKVDNNGAGYYIENCDLKGKRIGNCMISPKHANFIINLGGAISNDFASLAKLCQSKVMEKFGIQLEREVKYFGEFD